MDIKQLHEQIYKSLNETVEMMKWSELYDVITRRQAHAKNVFAIITDLLPVLGCIAVGGVGDEAIPLATTWLLYFEAGRIFDDIQDGKAKYADSLTRAHDMDMALAQVMLAQATFCDLDDSISIQARNSIQRKCAYAVAQAAKSQADEIKMRWQLPTEKQYFETVFKKTANLAGTAIWSGGRVMSSESKQRHILYQYGLACGISEQIRNDCRDLAIDLAEGLYTLPMIIAVQQDIHPLHKDLLALLDQSNTDEHIDELASLIKEMGCVTQAKLVARTYQAQGLELVQKMIDSPAQEYFRLYVEG